MSVMPTIHLHLESPMCRMLDRSPFICVVVDVAAAFNHGLFSFVFVRAAFSRRSRSETHSSCRKLVERLARRVCLQRAAATFDLQLPFSAGYQLCTAVLQVGSAARCLGYELRQTAEAEMRLTITRHITSKCLHLIYRL